MNIESAKRKWYNHIIPCWSKVLIFLNYNSITQITQEQQNGQFKVVWHQPPPERSSLDENSAKSDTENWINFNTSICDLMTYRDKLESYEFVKKCYENILV